MATQTGLVRPMTPIPPMLCDMPPCALTTCHAACDTQTDPSSLLFSLDMEPSGHPAARLDRENLKEAEGPVATEHKKQPLAAARSLASVEVMSLCAPVNEIERALGEQLRVFRSSHRSSANMDSPALAAHLLSMGLHVQVSVCMCAPTLVQQRTEQLVPCPGCCSVLLDLLKLWRLLVGAAWRWWASGGRLTAGRQQKLGPACAATFIPGLHRLAEAWPR